MRCARLRLAAAGGGRGTRGLLLEDGGGGGGGAGVACAGRVQRRVDGARPGLHLPIDDGADKAWVADQGLDWGGLSFGKKGSQDKTPISRIEGPSRDPCPVSLEATAGEEVGS